MRRVRPARSSRRGGAAEVRLGTAPARRTRVVVVIIVTSWCVVAGYVAHALLPGAAIRLPGPQPRTVQTVLPQGWAFFTKDVREDRSIALLQVGTKWEHDRIGPSGRSEHVFGIRRSARTRLGELTLLVERVPETAWRECERDWQTCLDDMDPLPLVSSALRSSWCGRVAVVAHEPVPWAWSRDVSHEEMPSRGVVMEVQCS